MTDNRDHTTDAPVGMQVWHDDPGPQPSPVPDERPLWFVFGMVFAALTFTGGMLLAWVVTP